MAKKSEAVEQEVVEPMYIKSQIIGSEKFGDCRDILSIVLEEDKTYTLSEIEGLVNQFKNKVIQEKKNGGKK